MAATIAGDSIPYLRDSSGDPKAPACSVSSASFMPSDSSAERAPSLSNMKSSGVKVDYVLALDIPEDTPLRNTIGDVIYNAVRGSNRPPHVNQTAYLALKDSPIAVAMEMKSENSSQDPLIQLGIWTAAWYEHMYDLRTVLAGPGPKPPLVSVPIFQVIGHQWYVYFVQDAVTSLNVYGPISLGSSVNVISMYILLNSLEAVRVWIEGTFRVSLEAWFMLDSDTPIRT